MIEPILDRLKYANIAYSNNHDTRFKSTAGGYITTLIEYLFLSNKISYAVSFDRVGIQFIPKLISSYSEYNNVGSIYQEIDIISFFKKNINNIKGTIVMTLLPCQVNIIRSLAKQNNIDIIIISLVCSAQMTLSCTTDYLRLTNINENEIVDFRYRGNGWPKYITINLKNSSIQGDKELWNSMFHSYFFHEKRCIKCTDTFGVKSDIAISDPWLGEKMKSEIIGKSIVYILSELGEEVHKEIINSGLIKIEKIEPSTAINSQYHTMQKKYELRNNKLLRTLIKYSNARIYKKIVLSNKYLLKLHSRLINKTINLFIKKQR